MFYQVDIPPTCLKFLRSQMLGLEKIWDWELKPLPN